MMLTRRPATTSGNQPPCGILTRLAPRNTLSMLRNTPRKPPSTGQRQPQRTRATTAKRTVVMAIVAVTTTP
jgi:hypothetical protein